MKRDRPPKEIVIWERVDRDGNVTAFAIVPMPGPMPPWCSVHEQFEWCGHNGGTLGPDGWGPP